MGTEMHIYGPPGTGKTTTLKDEYIAREAEQYGGTIPEINAAIAVSFSVTAVRHLRSRVGDYFDKPMEGVATLNALGHRQLGSLTLFGNTGKNKDDNPWQEWNKRGHWTYEPEKNSSDDKDDYGHTQGGKLLPVGNQMMMRYEGERQRGRGSELAKSFLRRTSVKYSREEYEKFIHDYEQFKLEIGCIDFVDQLSRPLDELLPPPYGAKRMYIDEAQDLTPLMLALVRMWSSEYGLTLIMAGDDDQCIGESLNGADAIQWISNPNAIVRVLPKSFRVSREVHVAAQVLAKRLTIRAEKEWHPAPHSGAVKSLRGNYILPAGIADKVMELESTGQSVMVIASCAYMLGPLLAILRGSGVRFHNPYRPEAWQWQTDTNGRGTSSYNKVCYLLTRKGVLTWRGAEYLESLIANPRDSGLFYSATEVKVRVADIKKNGDLDDEIDQHFVRDTVMAKYVENPQYFIEKNAKPGKDNSIAFAFKAWKRYGWNEDRPLVTVGTIFSVKGGEADNVILFPDISTAGAMDYRQNKDCTTRLFYVGVTRAKYNLYLPRPVGDNMRSGYFYPLLGLAK